MNIIILTSKRKKGFIDCGWRNIRRDKWFNKVIYGKIFKDGFVNTINWLNIESDSWGEIWILNAEDIKMKMIIN